MLTISQSNLYIFIPKYTKNGSSKKAHLVTLRQFPWCARTSLKNMNISGSQKVVAPKKVVPMNQHNNLPQAMCSAFATLLPPPQSSGQELESPVFGLMVSPGHGRHASRCPEKKAQ